MSDHAWVEQNLDAYVLGGMSADERETIAHHLAGCAECERAVEEARQVEKRLDDLLAEARPDAGLEDRVIQRLRRSTRSRAGVFRFVAAAAAVLVFGIVGAVTQAMLDDSAKGARGPVAQNKKDGFRLGVDVVGGTILPDVAGKKNGDADDRIASTYFPDIRRKYDLDSVDDVSEKLKDKAYDPVGIVEGRRDAPPVNLPAAPGGFGGKGPGVALETHKSDPRQAYGYFDDKLSGLISGLKSPGPTFTTAKPNEGSRLYYFDNGKLDEAQKEIAKSLDKLRDGDKSMKSVHAASMDQSKAAEMLRGREDSKGEGGIGKDLGYYPPPAEKGNKGPEYLKLLLLSTQPSMPSPNDPRMAGIGPPPSLPARPPGLDPVPSSDKDKEVLGKSPGTVSEPKGVEPPKQPEPAGRKIIRSGDMEFEVDAFYLTVNTIKELLRTKTKGAGFVATMNSDKLPNGKMRGSVVVRMPPEFLDDFLKDLREALAKTGVLKSEHIGSQDVTKAYTDVESELRAARAIEERFLMIIKSGKGEIKDLIAAERELGIWRTKIEKMEGEIRYYNNLISLSTVTIHLTEKEIQAATAMVLRERVQMNIEVEDVDDGQKSVRAGVKAAKGRILKSEMKRADAGQVMAEVHAEVPPASAELFRELLRKLGTVTRHQAERTQHAEGGSGKPIDIKEREDDVRFELSLYNTANIKPRETLHLKLAADKVPASYRKLKDAIEKVKGQIRKAHLDEQDKLDINAELDFNVAAADRKAIDDLIAEQGLVIKRATVQAAVNEMSTDRKIGYELRLRSMSAIAPKEIFRYLVTTPDVKAGYRTLFDKVAELKGRVHRSHVDDQDKHNIRAEFNFDIATSDKLAFDELLKELGIVTLGLSEQAAPNIDATDTKVGYRLLFRGLASVPPREVLTIQLAAQDVAGSRAQLQKEAEKLKGRVHRTQLIEHDQFNVSAVFDFDVSAKDRLAVDEILRTLGVVTSRSNAEADLKADVTDLRVGYRLTLKNLTSIPPRDTYTINIAAQDVPAAHLSLQKEAARLKGRVLHTQLLEQDRFNVAAVFHFDVGAEHRVEVDNLLKLMGVTLSRTNAQAGPKDDATDLKVGYRLTLKNVTSIPPRDIFTIHVASQDVAANHRKLFEEVTRLKGRVHKTQLNEQDRFNVSAEFDFDVNATDRAAIDELIKASGATTSRTNAQAGPKDEATDLKVGYRLTLKNVAGAEPREKTAMQIQVSDVNQHVLEFKNAVQAVKGRVIDSKFDRHENGKIEAFIVFEVPLSAQDNLVRQFRAAGYVEKHQTSPNKQVPENELSTAHLIVKLTTAGPIMPPDAGVGERFGRGLYLAMWVFTWCLNVILMGLAIALPMLFVIWVIVKGVWVLVWLFTGPKANIKTVELVATPAPVKPAAMGSETKPGGA